MGSKTNYLEDAVINYVLRNDPDTWPSPGTVYVGLFTATPGDAGGGTEVSGVNYARQSVAFDDPAGTGVTANTAEVAFPVAGAGGWGTIDSFAVFDAVSAGNMLYWGAISPSKTINENDQAKYAAGSLDITED